MWFIDPFFFVCLFILFLGENIAKEGFHLANMHFKFQEVAVNADKAMFLFIGARNCCEVFCIFLEEFRIFNVVFVNVHGGLHF